MRINYLLLIVLIYGLASCDDQPASIEEPIDPPELPSFDGLSYDFGVLGEIEPTDSHVSTPEHDEVDAPEELLKDVLAVLKHRVDGQLFDALDRALSPSLEVSGEFENGVFIWEYDLQSEFYSGIDLYNPAMLQGAHTEEDLIHWQLFIFGEQTETGEFLLVEAYSNADYTDSEWTIFDPEIDTENNRALETDWYVDEDVVKQLNVTTAFDPETGEPKNYTWFLVEDGLMKIRFNRVIADQIIQKIDAELSFDDGEGEMFYRLGAEQDTTSYCWDSDFDLVDC